MRSTEVTELRDVHDPSVKRADGHVELKDGFSVDLPAQNDADKGIFLLPLRHIRLATVD